MDVQQLAQTEQYILRIRDVDEPYAKQDFFRMEANGAILRVAHGAYVLVPERERRRDPDWRPPLERVAHGIAAAEFGGNEVALIGPSAARVHGALPRPLGIATVSYPSTRPRDIETLVGTVRTYRRLIGKMDVVRMNTDLVSGLVTSVEMTMLDLASKAPKWPIAPTDRDEAIRLLAARTDWDLATEIAHKYRKRTALESVHRMIEEAS